MQTHHSQDPPVIEGLHVRRECGPNPHEGETYRVKVHPHSLGIPLLDKVNNVVMQYATGNCGYFLRTSKSFVDSWRKRGTGYTPFSGQEMRKSDLVKSCHSQHDGYQHIKVNRELQSSPIALPVCCSIHSTRP